MKVREKYRGTGVRREGGGKVEEKVHYQEGNVVQKRWKATVLGQFWLLLQLLSQWQLGLAQQGSLSLFPGLLGCKVPYLSQPTIQDKYNSLKLSPRGIFGERQHALKQCWRVGQENLFLFAPLL